MTGAIDDNSGTGSSDRRAAMCVLALAPAEQLVRAADALGTLPSHEILRGPETGLVMVRGRAGGGGDAFNLGEVTVTRCTVKLATGEVGHAYITGRDGEKAKLAATLDGMLQRNENRADVEARVIAPLAEGIAASDRTRTAEAEKTKVDFFTMVRGDD
ncbi:phosphonate C-P lyase system protein PhnG [Tepidamorphus sp. 3E244]|uniref:phosphonate C-P lyase system protein PhnG n=1 Tax=Tepidamorphus sp. 3E244 TaxID=3385498 RepID=UPI0038FC2DCB